MKEIARDEAWTAECLRRDRASALVCAVLVAVVVPAWSPFDWLLERDSWGSFLALRSCVAAVGVLGLLVLRTWTDTRTVGAVAFVLMAVVGCGVAWMLPGAVHAYALYVLGFSSVVWGCGVIFTFTAARMALFQAVLLAAFVAAHVLQPALHAMEEVVGAGFYVGTAALISVLVSHVRLGLYRATFDAQRTLATRDRELDEARISMAEERAAHKAKSAFLARMSHELRTPLNAILGYSELVREELHDAGVGLGKDDLLRVEAAGRHLLALIDDVLDLSRIEAGHLTMEHSPIDLRTALREAVQAVRPTAERRGLSIELELPEAEALVLTDRRRLRQIVQKLLSNAVKFTERGGVRVTLAPRGDGFELVVHDTGPGIPAHLVDHVFEPFVQGDGSTTRRHEGSGVGLAIVREVVQRLGGQVAVSSTAAGSTFTVWIPTARG